MAEFVFKNNSFEFNGYVKQQVSGTATGTKCAPTYGCIYICGWGRDLILKRSRNDTSSMV